MKLFISYGHDGNAGFALQLKNELEKRGFDVWIDNSLDKHKGIKPGDDWRYAITKGINESRGVLACLSKHSIRVPGVCLDELRIAVSEPPSSSNRRRACPRRSRWRTSLPSTSARGAATPIRPFLELPVVYRRHPWATQSRADSLTRREARAVAS